VKNPFTLLAHTGRLLEKATQNLQTLEEMQIESIAEPLQTAVDTRRRVEQELVLKKKQLLTLLINLCVLANRTTIYRRGSTAVIVSTTEIYERGDERIIWRRSIDEMANHEDARWCCEVMIDLIHDYLKNPQHQNNVTALQDAMKQLSKLIGQLSP
jgi:hypothetical protein